MTAIQTDATISSAPSLVSESITDDGEATNTLILTSLSSTFFNRHVLDALRIHFASYGDLHSWAPLKGFGRIVMVYWNTDDAGRARIECDEMVLVDEEGRVISKPLRLFRGVHTGLVPEADYLPVPHTTHNFLISPPGSPPVGWEPVEEEAPNSTPLASDLIAALQRLQINRAYPQHEGRQIIMSPDDGPPGDEPNTAAPPGLTVFLEDTDFKVEDEGSGMITPVEEGLFEGERMAGGINLVKATVFSMRTSPGPGSAVVSPGAGKIARVPTPRPPPIP